jgi:hypothetical protein
MATGEADGRRQHLVGGASSGHRVTRPPRPWARHQAERDPARRRVFVCFCGACGWSGDIVLAARVVGHEAAG